jgi:exodeoxyribonuclease VII small subunit
MKRTAGGSAPSGAGTEETKSFESMMERLETLVEKLEGGNLSLEDSIKSFEEGMNLVKQCSSVLQEAEQRVQKLTRDADGKPALEGAGREGGSREPAPRENTGRSRRDANDVEDELPF